MNIVGRRVMIINEDSFYYLSFGIILGKYKDKYKIHLYKILNDNRLFNKNDFVLVDNDNKQLVNYNNYYCYLCNTLLKEYCVYYGKKFYFVYLKYCPNCLRRNDEV